MQPLGCFAIPPSHPSLPGHFPGNPVVPGVVLLAEVFALLLAAYPGRRIVVLPSAKFTAPVLPGHRIEVSCRPGPDDRLAFSASVDGRAVLRGTAVLGPKFNSPAVTGAA